MTRRATDPASGEATAVTVAAELPDPALAAVLVLLWVATGLVVARVLAARGHEFRAVAGLAGAMGPLFVPLAVDHLRRRDPVTQPVPLVGELTEGRRTVVLLAGEPERAADALPVLRRLEDPGVVTLAVPVGFSTLRGPADDVDRRAAELRARQAAVLLHEYEPVPVLAPGTPADVVRGLAADDRDLVLVVGEVGADRRSDVARAGVPVVTVPRTGSG